MSIAELYRSTGPITPTDRAERSDRTDALKNPSSDPTQFEKILQQHVGHVAETKGVKFSGHAETRIRSRAIDWNPELERRVSQGLDSAQEKGSRETLILAGDIALIANVKSRTIITAIESNQLKERIFTNIDSAVIV